MNTCLATWETHILPYTAGATTGMREVQHQSRSAGETTAADMSRTLDNSSVKREPVLQGSAAYAPQQAKQEPAGVAHKTVLMKL